MDYFAGLDPKRRTRQLLQLQLPIRREAEACFVVKDGGKAGPCLFLIYFEDPARKTLSEDCPQFRKRAQ